MVFGSAKSCGISAAFKVFLALVALAQCSLVSAAAGAAENNSPTVAASPHRIVLGAHLGMAVVAGDEDGHWSEAGDVTGAALGYAYALPGVELGAQGDYLSFAQRRTTLARALVRPHFRLNDKAEFGLRLSFGYSWSVLPHVPDEAGPLTFHDHDFRGLAYGIGPEIRLWTSPYVALDFGLELLGASGHDSSPANGSYLKREGGYALAGFTVGVAIAP